MTKVVTKTGAIISLSSDDVESAIRHFICECHPEFATGHVIDPSPGQKFLLHDVQFEAKRAEPSSEAPVEPQANPADESPTTPFPPMATS